MSKKQQEEDINIGEAYGKAEKFIEDNKRSLGIALGALLAVVLGVYYYFNMYLPPLAEEAEMEIFKAQRMFRQDSFRLALEGDLAQGYIGFEEIAEEYGSTPAGNTSRYYAGVCLLNMERYEEAIDVLKSYNPDDKMTSAVRWGAIGDAYAQLGDLPKALSQYEKASKAYENEFTTPIYLKKAGLIAEELGEYKEAAKHYETIKRDYQNSTEARDIEKYLARAQALAGEFSE
ncbi:MAG TPA: hypothetical protein DDX92_01785 [Flavobacteriales bacterium]|nr:hypothetical protein [Flavobacteriales bacterium]